VDQDARTKLATIDHRLDAGKNAATRRADIQACREDLLERVRLTRNPLLREALLGVAAAAARRRDSTPLRLV
jgi:hypothetical protein